MEIPPLPFPVRHPGLWAPAEFTAPPLGLSHQLRLEKKRVGFGLYFFPPSYAQEFVVVLRITWKCCYLNVFSLES